MSSVSLVAKPTWQKFSLHFALMLLVAVSSTTASAEDRMLGYEKTEISDHLLAEMGMDKVSDAEGMKVRGKFIIAPNALSAILNQSLNPGDFLAINFAATQSSQIIEQVTLDLSLSQYQAEITRQLGLEHESIDFRFHECQNLGHRNRRCVSNTKCEL